MLDGILPSRDYPVEDCFWEHMTFFATCLSDTAAADRVTRLQLIFGYSIQQKAKRQHLDGSGLVVKAAPWSPRWLHPEEPLLSRLLSSRNGEQHHRQRLTRLRPGQVPDIQRFSILNTFVPHTGQTPWVAGLRFLSITRRGLLISLFFLHFMQ